MQIWNGSDEYCWRYRADTILSTDGQTDGRTDGQGFPPFNFVEAGGIKSFIAYSLWTSAAIWWQRSGSTLAQVMNGFLPDGTKPLPEPMLTEVFWLSYEGNFKENGYPRGQRVKGCLLWVPSLLCIPTGKLAFKVLHMILRCFTYTLHSTCLLQNGALWDMRLVHCGICETGLLPCATGWPVDEAIQWLVTYGTWATPHYDFPLPCIVSNGA